VTATSVISKRYLKFLTKRYLKKSTLRDFVRVVATDKTTYSLSFYNVQGEDVSGGEEEEDEDAMDQE
jgi:large subunit ribosomal protein L22e